MALPSRFINPHFQHPGRAPYELPRLVSNLPEDGFPSSQVTDDMLNIARAASLHAGNASSTVLHGLEALGALLQAAASGDDFEMEAAKIADLGCLVQHLAVEAQYLKETQEWLVGEISRHEDKVSANSPVTGSDR